MVNSKNWLNSSNYKGIRSLFHLLRVRQSTAKFVQIRSVWGKFGESLGKGHWGWEPHRPEIRWWNYPYVSLAFWILNRPRRRERPSGQSCLPWNRLILWAFRWSTIIKDEVKRPLKGPFWLAPRTIWPVVSAQSRYSHPRNGWRPLAREWTPCTRHFSRPNPFPGFVHSCWIRKRSPKQRFIRCYMLNSYYNLLFETAITWNWL
jgi:hypothetical protein